MYEEALEYAEKVLKMIPCHDAAIQLKAKALMYLKRFDEYERLIKEAKNKKDIYKKFFLRRDVTKLSFGQTAKLQSLGNFYDMRINNGLDYYDGENFITYAKAVEIKRDEITGGFGLFATREIQPGEIILVDRTIMHSHDQGNMH